MIPVKSAGPGIRVRVREGVGVRQFDQEWIVLDLVGGQYFGLDEVGGRIWTLVAAGHTPQEIANLLAGEYDVAHHVLERDTVAFVQRLLDLGLAAAVESAEGDLA
jgi:hypothetical protein